LCRWDAAEVAVLEAVAVALEGDDLGVVHQLRPIAGDSPEAQAVKVVTRMHKTLIWERTRASQRLRPALREYFPAALAAFEDLDASHTWNCLRRPPIRPPPPA
jgi:hypothetical protein